jgi:hypothetical protein
MNAAALKKDGNEDKNERTLLRTLHLHSPVFIGPGVLQLAATIDRSIDHLTF